MHKYDDDDDDASCFTNAATTNTTAPTTITITTITGHFLDNRGQVPCRLLKRGTTSQSTNVSKQSYAMIESQFCTMVDNMLKNYPEDVKEVKVIYECMFEEACQDPETPEGKYFQSLKTEEKAFLDQWRKFEAPSAAAAAVAAAAAAAAANDVVVVDDDDDYNDYDMNGNDLGNDGNDQDQDIISVPCDGSQIPAPQLRPRAMVKGGWVENFTIFNEVKFDSVTNRPKTELLLYDFNSLYPSIGLENKYASASCCCCC